jgi:type II secretory pathway pseudopilin PulG
MGKINKRKQSKNLAFTLIEVVVVAGIIALFSVTLVSVFLATIRGGSKSQLTQVVHQEGDFALKTMVNVIRGADQVACGGGGIDILTLTGSVINFSTLDDNGIIRVASDSSTFLTGNRATVTDLEFTCSTGMLNNQVVTINLELTAGEVGGQIQERTVQTFATSVSTRQY